MPTISIGFQIQNNGNGFQELILDADKFKNLLTQTVTEAKKLDDKMINFGSISIGLDALSSAFQQLQGFTKEFTSAYDTQMEAEYKLEQVMKKTMGARADEIQSIKDFCSAQQQIGIVGDEVQLAGAQEMATYVTMKGTLKTLIPVMNDMVAQQHGYNHTAENATSIATMLGKVMQGQTDALSRYGYKFNEAQEKILKYGTEAERAAIIAEVVGESVGGMNKKLAETDTGKMKQLENYVGDLKEQIGGMFKKADPFIAMAANSATAFIGLQKLRSGVLALVKSMNMLKLAGGAVGLAIAAIAAAYVYFTSNTDKATQAMKEFTDAKKQQEREEQHAKEIIEAEDEARKSAIASLELNKAKIENFKGSKAEERKLVKELNDTYGRTMGYFKSLSEWYQALEKNSDAYCQQLVKEAKARKLADQVADLELKRDDISEKQETVSKEKKKRAVYIPGSLGQVDHYEEDPSEYEKLEAAKNNIDIEIERKKRAIREAEIPVVMPVMGSTTEPELGGGGGGSSTPKTRLQEIDAAIKSNEEKWRSASEAEKSAILSTVNALREEKRAIELHQAELSRPLELKSIQDFNDEISYQQKLLASASKENAASIQQTIDALELQREALSVPAELKSIDDYNKALSYQQKLRSMASAEEIAQHDQVIKQLTEERDAMERAAHVAIDADKITSYRQLQDEISYYTDLLQNGTEKEKRFATENLPALMKKEKAMGIQNAGIGIATDPAQANTLDEVGAAISLLEQKIQNASADEIDALQRSKMAFEEKKKVLERGIEIPQMQKEIADIMGLSDAEMTIKIRDIGFDTLAERIKEIQSMLNDLDNPPTEGQRQALEEVMGVYEQWKEKCVDSKEVLVSTLNQASSAFSGLGDAFEMPELNVVGIIAGAVATMIQGFASASAQSSSMGPWGWAAFSLAGLAQLAAMVSQIKGMGAFAEGGIVSGPTLGLVGEYAGAKNNPEVIAPLNRLKDLIGNDENGANGRVEFEIRGDRLYGLLRKYERNKSRT